MKKQYIQPSAREFHTVGTMLLETLVVSNNGVDVGYAPQRQQEEELTEEEEEELTSMALAGQENPLW